MTDNEIIKAAECCTRAKTRADCFKLGCPSATAGGDGCCIWEMTDDDSDDAVLNQIIEKLVTIINRQKAEIERLQKFKMYFDGLYGCNLEVLGWHENGDVISFDEFYDSAISDMENAEYHTAYIIKIAKSEAIKEFAERLTSTLVNTPFGINCSGETDDYRNGCLRGLVEKQNKVLDVIDNLVKEMVGDAE